MGDEPSVFAAHVDGDAIYALLLGVDKKVDRIEAAVATTQDKVEDHEARLRDLEAHGSSNAQEAAEELVRTRARLHTIEGTQSFQTAIISENAEAIKSLRAALVKLAFLAVGAVLTALATLLVALLLAS